MPAWIWAVLVVLALAVGAGVAWWVFRRQTTRRLRDRFGPEYDRAVAERGDVKDAEVELQRREKRVEHFEVRPLSPDERVRFESAWEDVQAKFVDSPSAAIAEADILVAEVMRTRGYPVSDFEQRASDLSVEHPLVVEHYRAAREIAVRNEAGKATTEELRQALVHHRRLFEELLRTPKPMEVAR